MMEACKGCLHCEACEAWVRHGKMLYSDFAYSVEECPYFEDRTANGVTVQEWIPVTERLPDAEGSYLVHSRKSKTVFTAHYRPSISEWANRANGQFITHWMPLPEPPKED